MKQGAHDESAPGLTELHEWREKGTPPNRKTIWAPLSLLVLVISDLRAGNCACLHFCLLVGGREHFFYLVTRTSTTSGLRRQSGPGSPAQIPSPLPPPHASPVLAAPLQRQQERHPPTGRTKNEKAGFFFWAALHTNTLGKRREQHSMLLGDGRKVPCLWEHPQKRGAVEETGYEEEQRETRGTWSWGNLPQARWTRILMPCPGVPNTGIPPAL